MLGEKNLSIDSSVSNQTLTKKNPYGQTLMVSKNPCLSSSENYPDTSKTLYKITGRRGRELIYIWSTGSDVTGSEGGL